MTVCIGDLRRVVVIQSSTGTADGMGGKEDITWSDFLKVFAKIEPYSAREQFEKQQLKPRVTHKVTIRYVDGLTSDMRVKYGDRYLQIKGIRNIFEKDRFMELACEEGVPA